jgi:diacylglycerol O-acyltransferase
MEEMTGLDARFLYSETPTAHMHTIKVVIVDVRDRAAPLGRDLLVSLLDRALDRMPVLRRRTVPAPWGISHPVWVEAPGFDVRRHLQWRQAPTPGDRRALCAVVAEVAGTALPRDLPLWELTVVDGLADGRLAFVMKLHHAVADGVAAAAMLENAFMADPSVAVSEPPRPTPLPSRAELARYALRRRAGRVVRFPQVMWRSGRGALAVRRVQRGAGQRVTTVFAGPRSPLNVSLDHERTFAVIDLPMAEVLEVRTRLGTSVNDVFLATCGGGLRRYLTSGPGLPAQSLVAGVPIATQTERFRLSGNHVDNMVVPLRTDVADPIERVRAIAEASRLARQARDVLGTDLFERRARHTPPRLYPLALRWWAATHLADRSRPPLNVVASNVAGPRTGLAVDGGEVTELWSVGPILEGIGINLTAWSYAGTLALSVLGCQRSLPDPWVLADHLRGAFDELVVAVRRSSDAWCPDPEAEASGIATPQI